MRCCCYSRLCLFSTTLGLSVLSKFCLLRCLLVYVWLLKWYSLSGPKTTCMYLYVHIVASFTAYYIDMVAKWVHCYASIMLLMYPSTKIHSFHRKRKHHSECTMGNIAQGWGWEVNIAQGKAECYFCFCLETRPCAIFSLSAWSVSSTI